MKPLHLSVKGLFSYRNQAEIDFTPLTEAGLFGIFGPVGSGKSSILDAMTLALYGESERLSTQDRRNYNLMNLQSSELRIQFRFIHDGKEYLFTVEGNRHSKRYDEVKSFKRRAYRIESGEARALNDENRAFSAQEIIGISYDNFKRTIIIPQGRFQEFLQLTPGNRRTMMKELFGLERYDLKNPTSSLLQAAKQERSGVEGSLELLQHATEEELKRIRSEVSLAEERSTTLLEEKTAAQRKLQELDQSADLVSRLESARQEYAALEAQQETVQQQREWLQAYEECSRRFAAGLHNVEEKIRSYKTARQNQQSAAIEREELVQRQADNRRKYESVKQSHEQKDSKEAEAEQLEAFAALKALLKDAADLDSQKAELGGEHGQLEEELKALQNERAGLKEKIEQLQAETAVFDDLHEISKWYSDRQSLLQQSSDLQTRIDQHRRDAEKQVKVLQTAAADLESKAAPVVEARATDSPGPAEEPGLAGRIHSLSTELGALEGEISTALAGVTSGGSFDLAIASDLRSRDGSLADESRISQLFEAAERAVNEALQQLRRAALTEDSTKLIFTLSRQLKPDSPCPVCGSLEHPSPAHQQFAEESSEAQTEGASGEDSRIALLEELLSSLIQHKTACTGSIAFIISRLDEIFRLQESRAKLDSQLSDHLEKFRWEQYSPEDDSAFQAANVAAQKARSGAAAAQSRLQKLEERIEQLSGEMAEYQRRVQQLEQQRAVLDHKRGEEAAKLSEELRSRFEDYSSSDLSEKAAELREEVQRVETEFRSLEKQLHADEIDLRSAEATEDERRRQREAAVEQLHKTAVVSARNLEQSSFESIHVVKQILSASVDVEKLRNEVDTFNQKFSAVKERLCELTERTQGIEYSPDAHQSARENAQKLDSEYAELLGKKGGLQQQAKSMERDLYRKKELQEHKQGLEDRIENLNVLFRLFKGQGFVNFVATKYLHDLCARANERFFHLTRKQLRLEINAENDFVIRDYLNGGRLRSVKTLSGGQMFQASFSLALALADSIHQNKESFFFLDEGFGSLDRRSLQDVFDTLKSLRKENRIVGVISHVEELREEIPVSLQVSEDQETGSRITSSL